MNAQLPDQSAYTGFIPKDLYNSFVKNKALYDQQGKSYPYHYYQYYGIPYKVYYGDPYTLIDYVDVSTPVYNPVVGIPGLPPGVTIVVGDTTPPSPDMILPGMGVPDPNKKAPQPVTPTPTPVTTTTPATGTGGFGGNAAAWAWVGMITAIAYGFAHIRRRKARK